MPTNPYKEQKECFVFIDRLLTKNLKEIGSIQYNEVIRQSLTSFAVGRLAVTNFIDECYIQTGIVKKENDTLYYNEV